MCVYWVGIVWLLCKYDLYEALSTAADGCGCICLHVCVHQLGGVRDGWRWLAAWRQIGYISIHVIPLSDGRNRWSHGRTNTVKDTSLIHSHVFLNCSFGYSKVKADVTGHCLCTNYVWDSCERRGPHQRTHLLLQGGNEWIPSVDANTEILHKPVVHQGFSLMDKLINVISIIIINTKIFPDWLKGNSCKWFNI